MPDTFSDFQKQRFRWAYGAVIIMRAHLMPLLGLERTRLTRASATTSSPVGCHGSPMGSTWCSTWRPLPGRSGWCCLPQISRRR